MNTRIIHRDWRTDVGAARFPWAVAHDGVVVAMATTINVAGDVARDFEWDGKSWN